MSHSNPDPFASTGFNTGTRRDSARSTRPPSFTSIATATPTYTSNEPSADNYLLPAQRIHPGSWSVLNTPRTGLPPYTPSDAVTTNAHHHRRARIWDAPDTDDQAESSLTDTDSAGETSAEVTRPGDSSPRYIYYRIYTKDGGIPSVNAVYSDDPYLGRILAHTVAPPHTAISLKLCLSNVENIPYNTLTGLFRTVSSEAPMDDTNHLSILAEPGPGCTPDDPVALVTTHSHADRSALDTVNPKKLPPQDAASPCEMRYIYYRTYAEDGAVPSMNPVYSDDPYVGRIMAMLVTPPHTVISLKRCLSNVEGIDNETPTSLFVSASSRKMMDDTGSVSILSNPGPGCTPNEPLALVAKFSSTSKISFNNLARAPLPQVGTSPFDKQYLYYRVYKIQGATQSKQPADPSDLTVGYINVDSITPPHTAASVKRCIAKSEGLEDWKESQLCISISSESTVGEAKFVSLLTSDRPWSTPGDPMAFIEAPHARWNKRLKVVHGWNPGPQNTNWLAITAGEILRTNDDGPRNQPLRLVLGTGYIIRSVPSYEAVNATGKVGFVHATMFPPSAVQRLIATLLTSILVWIAIYNAKFDPLRRHPPKSVTLAALLIPLCVINRRVIGQGEWHFTSFEGPAFLNPSPATETRLSLAVIALTAIRVKGFGGWADGALRVLPVCFALLQYWALTAIALDSEKNRLIVYAGALNRFLYIGVWVWGVPYAGVLAWRVIALFFGL